MTRNQIHMKYLLSISCIILLFLNMAYSQNIKGKIIDADSKVPLSYVHVGIMNKPIGTITDEQGLFNISISQTMSDDTISFSMIGYQQEYYIVNSIKDDYLIIELKKVAYSIEEIVIQEKSIKTRIRTLGRKKGKNNYTGSTEIGWGGEMGIKIKANSNDHMVLDINYKVMEITYDSILFRVNMYTTNRGIPDKTILNEPIYILGKMGERWIKKSLEYANIIFNKEIIATVESIKAWPNNTSGYGVFYCNGKGYRSKTYYKEASMSKWKTKKEPKMTLFLTTKEIME